MMEIENSSLFPLSWIIGEGGGGLVREGMHVEKVGGWHRFFFCYVLFISNVEVLSYGIGHRYVELEKKDGRKDLRTEKAKD